MTIAGGQREGRSSSSGRALFESASACGREGEYYSNARWYDPTLGRFITEDPARDGINWFAYVSNNPLRYIDPSGLVIGDVVADSNMQSAKGLNLGPSKLQIAKKGCVATAWARIVNAMNGDSKATPSSFGEATRYNGSQLEKVTNANAGYVSQSGSLDMAEFVSNKAKGDWAVEKTDKNIAETLAALSDLKVTAYVTGSGDLVDGHGNHTVNIVGAPGENGLIPVKGTSDYDSAGPTKRNYSVGPSNEATNTTQITGLTFAIPTSQQKAFSEALNKEIAKTQLKQQQQQAAKEGQQ